MLFARKDVDDEHGATTLWTNEGGVIRGLRVVAFSGVCVVLNRTQGRFSVFTPQQFAGPRQMTLSLRIGDQSVVAYAVKA